MEQALNLLFKQYDSCKTPEAKAECLKTIQAFLTKKGM
jgi:hypothetical protein